jgi:hypothetical protein
MHCDGGHAPACHRCPRMPQLPGHARACPGMPRHATGIWRPPPYPPATGSCAPLMPPSSPSVPWQAHSPQPWHQNLTCERQSQAQAVHLSIPTSRPGTQSGSAPALRAAHAHPHSGTHSAAQTPRARSKNHPPGRMSPPPASPPDLPPEPAGPSTILVANLPSAMWAQHVGSRSEGRADGGG